MSVIKRAQVAPANPSQPTCLPSTSGKFSPTMDLRSRRRPAGFFWTHCWPGQWEGRRMCLCVRRRGHGSYVTGPLHLQRPSTFPFLSPFPPALHAAPSLSLSHTHTGQTLCFHHTPVATAIKSTSSLQGKTNLISNVTYFNTINLNKSKSRFIVLAYVTSGVRLVF
jgi:hypothetical protein